MADVKGKYRTGEVSSIDTGISFVSVGAGASWKDERRSAVGRADVATDPLIVCTLKGSWYSHMRPTVVHCPHFGLTSSHLT